MDAARSRGNRSMTVLGIFDGLGPSRLAVWTWAVDWVYHGLSLSLG